ncbi:Gfo/Idh/MocA family oxidoreductase [Anaerosacchariphilus polymeriproducens]|uniref:Inositol 2-dehydrogenase n=1 Tax=Anaerosacchariphilus polymeriproducens TaxID=1812858 RepID=A0A371ATL2_9FIRM|nr:Gfo/Idh/MocA family oxidoreductase [Anaerosacchariphilus polymeriproducens]RDU22913.1 inositol 2-dehydrogenase [Anaerosacchariphilus polymeriproducens]
MKRVKIGIAGLGRLGRTHAQNLAFKIPQAELTAACSIVDAELDYAKNELGITELYKDFSEMVNKADIDAVVIVTPSTEHPWQIEAALKAGKQVFCEKPLAVTIEECKATEKIVEQYPDQIVMLGFMRRFDPSYAYAKEKIKAGAIGQPYLVKATGIDPEADCQSLIDSGFIPKSGGIFIDMAVHDIDLMRWFLEADAKEVYALGCSFKHPEFKRDGDCETGCAMFEFENGAMGQIHVGRTAPHGYHIETEIVGTEGSIRISPVPAKNLAILYDTNGVVQECVRNFPERFSESYVLELEEFINCVIHKTKPSVTVYDGTKATQMAFAAKAAFENHVVTPVEH